MDQRLSETSSSPLPSSSSSIPSSFTSCSSSSLPFSSAISVTVDEEPTSSCSSQVSVTIERQGNNHSAHCKWKIHNFSSKLETRALWSDLFEIEGFNCRLLVYPNGDSQSQSGYCSIYLHIIINKRKECFASYRLSIVNLLDESKSVRKDAWHRFSINNKSHGWCDFALISTIVDPESGFISTDDDDDCVVITVDILVLQESIMFFRDSNEFQQASTLSSCPVVEGKPLFSFLDGRFTWKVHNFSLFKEKIKTQKLMSSFCHDRNCSLSISVYQSYVNGTEYLSMCLESMKSIYKSDPDRSCWCLFRISVKSKKQGLDNMHRDSYGRLAIDSRSCDNASLGWNDYMKMSDFISQDLGFLVKDTAVFTASFQIIRESYGFKKSGGSLGERSMGEGQTSDGYIGKFTWRIHEFKRLRDLSKNRNLFGLCVKSRRFQIGDRDCRLLVYPCPRGQSQTPCQLSLFLEVTDSRNTASDWSCFVSQRLSVVNQWKEENSISKESQNRYCKDAKEWGWCEFVKLSSLFDKHAGFLVQDSVVFSAEVLILKETSEIQDFSGQDMELSNAGGQTAKRSFTWKVKNFSSFKEIMETRKIFSKFFQVDGFELRIGVYESFDTFYMYLESDQSARIDPDKNFWVKYKMGVVNQMNSDKTFWKESTMFTNTWNKFVLPFMKVSDMLEGDAGFLLGDTIVFVCYIMNYSPWFDFSEEFKFNPNAKSFSPSQTPLRSPSPVSDGSYYFRNNVSAVQHILPMGVGIETSFARPRPVMYNPQAAPNQLPQALIHPSAHLIGTLFAGPPPVIYNPQAAPIQSPPAFIHPNALLIGTSFAGPRPVMYNPQAAPIQSPQAFIHPNTHLAPIQSSQAFILPNTHLPVMYNPQAAPIQSPQAFIHPNTHPAPVQSQQAFIHPNAHLAPIQSPQAFIHPNTHLIGTSFAGPQPVMYNPQAAPIQSPQAFIHPNAHLAPIQSPQAFNHPNAHLAPIQSLQAFIHPNTHPAPVQSPQAFILPNTHLAPIQSPQAFIHPDTHPAALIQSPQAFIHPNAHLYGRPVIMGHQPRQVMYIPGYPPIRRYQ